VAFGDLLLAEDAGRIDNARGRQQPENDQSQPHEFRSPIYAADYTLSLANFKGPFCRDYHASSAPTKPPGRAGSRRGRALLRRDHAERGLLAGLSGKYSPPDFVTLLGRAAAQLMCPGELVRWSVGCDSGRLDAGRGATGRGRIFAFVGEKHSRKFVLS
jgi:hypothetical protein